MELAGKHLLGMLCPARDYLPYWNLKIEKDYRAALKFGWPAHNLGRWWDALLRLEDATGFTIPAHLEGAMLRNLWAFFDNPDHLCQPPPQYAKYHFPPEGVELHSLRESLLGLYALARYRRSQWAVDQGRKMIETVWRISREDGGWDLDRLEAYRRNAKAAPRHMDPVGSNGRMIEVLVWFYRCTGFPLALRLAGRFARYHLEKTTHADGTMNLASRADHTHSYLGTLRGLLLFGELTNQREYIERVAATYRVNVLRLIKKSGFIAHDLETEGTAEPTSVGDVVQLGLWLARHGHTEFLDDSERLVRCRLLPCQITESPNLTPVAADGADEHWNLNARAVGAYGGMHEPYSGKNPVTDITCAVLHSVVDVFRHIVVRAPAGLVLNFHFDCEHPRIRVASERSASATVTIQMKARENVLVRVPRWAPAPGVRFTVNDRPWTPAWFGNFAYIPRDLLPGTIVLRYDLPVHRTVERTAGVDYTLVWRGDEIIGISPNTEFFPFYPTA